MPIQMSHSPAGFSLVELTVATAIYSMGLGSLSLMLLLAVQGTSAARLETTAAVQAESLAEMILMTSDAAGHYALPPEPGATPCNPTQGCTPEDLAAWQLTSWQRHLATELPGGKGLVCHDTTPHDGDAEDPACSGEGDGVIKVFWLEPAEASQPDRSSTRHVLRLP